MYNYLNEFGTCSKILSQIKCVEIKDNVQISKFFSHRFLVQNFRKRNILSPLFLSFLIIYAIRKVQTNRDELKIKGTRHILYIVIVLI